MLEEMPESQRRTEGWSEHLTGGSSNFIFGEVELAAFERSNSISQAQDCDSADTSSRIQGKVRQRWLTRHHTADTER